MGINKIDVTQEELNNVCDFFDSIAKKEKKHRFQVAHGKIKKAKITQEPENIQRINHSMKRSLKERGYSVQYTHKGYWVTIPVTFNLNSKNSPLKKSIPPDKDEIETFSSFTKPYTMPAIYLDVKKALLHMPCTPFIVGPQGCGKSRLAEEIAARGGFKAVRVPLSSIRDPFELLGQTHVFEENGVSVTKFIGGILPLSVENGWWLILDEIDNASLAADEVLKQITETNGHLVLTNTEYGINKIEKHPDFRMICTANTWGTGDISGMFGNAEVKNAAFMSRLGPRFDMNYCIPAEIQIMQEQEVPTPVIDAFFKQTPNDSDHGLIPFLRNMFEEENYPVALPTRQIEQFADFFSVYGWHKAFYYCILNSFEPHYRNKISMSVISKIGTWAEPSNDETKIKGWLPQARTKGFVLS